MQITEKLSWILDHQKLRDQPMYDATIDFVHSLGLKCDCVGWCDLSLDRPDLPALLEKIKRFASENDFGVRGIYTRTLIGKSAWYVAEGSRPSWDYNYTELTDDSGKPVRSLTVKAYTLPKGVHLLDNSPLPIASERFKNACEKHSLTGIDFYWIQDTGRYKAAQFFGLMVKNGVTRFGCDDGLGYDGGGRSRKFKTLKEIAAIRRRLNAAGGYLPALSEIFYDLNIFLPFAVEPALMPDSDFAYLSYNTDDYHRQELLIRENAAAVLLSEGILRPENLSPLIVSDTIPAEYSLLNGMTLRYPEQESLKAIGSQYKAFLKKEMPVRSVSEKEALSLMRRIKRENPEDFQKPLSAAAQSPLADTPFAPLLPYYKIGSEILLNDETTLLAYTDALKETEEYTDGLQKEELLAEKIEGIVIAKAIDGDCFILKDGAVYRISHEDMSVCGSWPTLPDFIGETLIEK